uniref:Fed tick salivary protein 2 n=1 Tax=Ixodes scapularis TaxID=6945 RepID=Q5S1X8_IXOSC|nr:fed tick salivary protein 2 [Ixodes scapularis]
MKTTIAVLCSLVAVAYTLVVEAKTETRGFDPDALNPKCEKPKVCPGNNRTVYYYNRRGGCKSITLGADCTDNGNYETLRECQQNCLSVPGNQVGHV